MKWPPVLEKRFINFSTDTSINLVIKKRLRHIAGLSNAYYIPFYLKSSYRNREQKRIVRVEAVYVMTKKLILNAKRKNVFKICLNNSVITPCFKKLRNFRSSNWHEKKKWWQTTIDTPCPHKAGKRIMLKDVVTFF